jgi:hypothetical protein
VAVLGALRGKIAPETGHVVAATNFVADLRLAVGAGVFDFTTGMMSGHENRPVPKCMAAITSATQLALRLRPQRYSYSLRDVAFCATIFTPRRYYGNIEYDIRPVPTHM